MTTFSSQQLSILAEDPLFFSSRAFSSRLTDQVNQYSHESRAIGGYWSANIGINESLRGVEDWIQNGLGRHIQVLNPGLEIIWEGFVDQITASLGRLQFTIGPLMEIGNRVTVRYSIVISATDGEGFLGTQVSTSVANNTTSQDLYGIIEKAYAINGATDTQAEQLRDMLVNDPTRAYPATSRNSNLSGRGGPRVQLKCLGYWHWLKAYLYVQAASFSQVDFGIETLLGQDPNGIFSTDYSQIGANSSLVSIFGAGRETAETFMKRFISYGDSSNNSFLGGFFANRVFVYETLPTAIELEQRITGNEGITNIIGSEVKPWDIQPGQWLLSTDFLTGRFPPITSAALGADPRAGLVEVVKFTAPYDVSVNGAKLSQADQVLAKRGLGSQA